MTFQKKFDLVSKANSSFVCIGLDIDISKLPKHLLRKKFPIFEFNKAIIDATHSLVCAYKPNSAFYEAYGDKGILQLKMTFDYLRKKYPKVITILDAKRGDIGTTNLGYTSFAFDYLEADAITLHPYLGKESLEPFLKKTDKGCIILCRTSNSGGGEFQDLKVKGNPLYKVVATKVVKDWNTYGNCMLVIGATYPKELKEVRKIVGDMVLLIPGVGAQGGDVKQIMKVGINSKKSGLIISSSRGIIYASQNKDFAEKAMIETKKLRDEINSYL